MNDTQTKIEQSARIADIVLKTALILGYVLIAFMILIFGLAAVFYGILGPEYVGGLIGSENITLTSAGTEFNLHVDMLPGIIASFAVVSFVYMGLLMTILFYAGKIFSSIRKTRIPFTEENAKNLKITAVLIAVISVVPSLIESIGTAIIGFSLDMFYFSIEGLVLAFVVYSLAHIFEYGLNLQEQADETL